MGVRPGNEILINSGLVLLSPGGVQSERLPSPPSLACSRARLLRRRRTVAGPTGSAATSWRVPRTVPIASTVADAIRAVAEATDMQPEAIVVAFCHDRDQRLAGAVSLVALVQSAPASSMEALADPSPVHVHADADIDEITRAMADYNLLVLPVLDRDDHQIGVLTIDDILEAAIAPERRRGQA
jgi:CBS domain-containing protein